MSSPGASSPEPLPQEAAMKSSPPKSVNQALAAQNGSGPHSPRAKRRTPSPSPAEPLNLGSSIRQLGKLKRFLTTLLQFGRDVSPEAGDKVHGLILALVNSTLTIEEFHQKLQDITNYPLRSFVIPFLKAHLPLLQSELLYFSRLSQQTPQQYLRQHEHLLLDPALHPAAEPFEIFQPDKEAKRRSPRPRDNGYDDGAPPAKRLHASMSSPPPYRHLAARFEENSTLFREQRYERYERSLHREFAADDHDTEDEWKNIHTMLNCILGMVEKTKRALAILQHRSLTEQRPPADFLSWSRSRHLDGTEYDIKKRSSEMLVHYKEDRVLDVRRRTEDAAVKRTAELQKEGGKGPMVELERVKKERLLGEARRQDEVYSAHQEDSTENCWNCGRKASETCSGCNQARYCGAFCQRKDWEIHHKHCRQASPSRPAVDVKPLLLAAASKL